MKDKEKQIEEMAFDLTMIVQVDYYGHTLFKETAESLVNQGYRKLPKDSVVLSREEYEKQYDEKWDNYRDGENNAKVYYENIVIPKLKEQSRKETAEKIYDFAKGFFEWDEEGFVWELTKYIKTELGVEIKE